MNSKVSLSGENLSILRGPENIGTIFSLTFENLHNSMCKMIGYINQYILCITDTYRILAENSIKI